MLLTVLAVVLGTAFISGSFILTKSRESTYNQAVNGANAGTDVIVQADDKDGRIIAEQWENIKALPGVAPTRMADKQYVVLSGIVQPGNDTALLIKVFMPEGDYRARIIRIRIHVQRRR